MEIIVNKDRSNIFKYRDYCIYLIVKRQPNHPIANMLYITFISSSQPITASGRISIISHFVETFIHHIQLMSRSKNLKPQMIVLSPQEFIIHRISPYSIKNSSSRPFNIWKISHLLIIPLFIYTIEKKHSFWTLNHLLVKGLI